jgi:hypothetical protein
MLMRASKWYSYLEHFAVIAEAVSERAADRVRFPIAEGCVLGINRGEYVAANVNLVPPSTPIDRPFKAV